MSRNINDFLDSGEATEIKTTNVVTTGVTPLDMQDTVWDDISGYVIGYKFDSTRGAWDFNYRDGTLDAVNNIDATDERDYLILNFQSKHNAYNGAGAVFRFHLHYLQSQDKNIEWVAKYRLLPIGNDVDVTWKPLTKETLKVTYNGSGTAHQIQTFSSINTETLQLSGIVQVKVARKGTDILDTWSGNVRVLYPDCHYQIGILGSKDEYNR